MKDRLENIKATLAEAAKWNKMGKVEFPFARRAVEAAIAGIKTFPKDLAPTITGKEETGGKEMDTAEVSGEWKNGAEFTIGANFERKSVKLSVDAHFRSKGGRYKHKGFEGSGAKAKHFGAQAAAWVQQMIQAVG